MGMGTDCRHSRDKPCLELGYGSVTRVSVGDVICQVLKKGMLVQLRTIFQQKLNIKMYLGSDAQQYVMYLS